MSSIAHSVRDQLAALGEYVVLANIASGWFAVFESTFHAQSELAARHDRPGPNLVIYRTRDETSEPRDHYVVPYSLFRTMVTDETVATAKIKSSRRWNFTLKNDRLRVTHGSNFIDVTPYYRAPLAVEEVALPAPTAKSDPVLRFQPKEALEGLAREYRSVSRSRSATLREAALRKSAGVCEACGVNFAALLGGLGTRALQVHHKNQLANSDTEVITSMADLAVLCANCHSLVHADAERPTPVEQLQAMWRKERCDA